MFFTKTSHLFRRPTQNKGRKEVNSPMNKNVRYIAIAFVIFYLLSQPENAAAVVNNAFSAVGDAGTQLAIFVNTLVT